MRSLPLCLALVLTSPLAAQAPTSPRTSGRTGDATAPVDSGNAADSLRKSHAPHSLDDPHDLTPARRTVVRNGPNGRVAAVVEPGSRLQVTARDRGWLRVQVQGWVRERELVPADSTLRHPLSAADLRAEPDGSRGKLVRWEVQVLAFQIADPLRRDLAPDEPYLLARGPGTENALLYLTIPPALLTAARSIAPLSHAVVTARVRTGRSDPAGVPVLDLLSIAAADR